ncbi:hypothetical protein E2C01_067647 [Portunus trituberculatus]|uniref:Uncharacterized protein n=1 Tax=Portunus trituberculatus TaxID=210409 RepID=A0A5B7HT77_PORTR|nr:hypothetical protein [Portunus trituberculatus]
MLHVHKLDGFHHITERGTALTISSDVSMLRPSSSQEARSETEGVTEELELPLPSGLWRTHGHVHRVKP